MNQQLQQFLFNYNRMMTAIDFSVVVDGSGDPLISTLAPQGNGIESVEHLGTGQYRLHLKSNFNAGLAIMANPFCAPADAPSGLMNVEAAQSSDVTDAADPHVDLNCFDSTGTLVDPIAYSGFNGLILVRNSSVKK